MNTNTNMSEETKKKIQNLKDMGYNDEEIVVLPDGSVTVGYVDEFQGIVRRLQKADELAKKIESKSKEEPKTSD